MCIDIQHIEMMYYQLKKLSLKNTLRELFDQCWEETLPDIFERLGAWALTNKRLMN